MTTTTKTVAEGSGMPCVPYKARLLGGELIAYMRLAPCCYYLTYYSLPDAGPSSFTMFLLPILLSPLISSSSTSLSPQIFPVLSAVIGPSSAGHDAPIPCILFPLSSRTGQRYID